MSHTLLSPLDTILKGRESFVAGLVNHEILPHHPEYDISYPQRLPRHYALSARHHGVRTEYVWASTDHVRLRHVSVVFLSTLVGHAGQVEAFDFRPEDYKTSSQIAHR